MDEQPHLGSGASLPGVYGDGLQAPRSAEEVPVRHLGARDADGGRWTHPERSGPALPEHGK